MRQVIAKDSPNRQHITLVAAFDFFNRRLFAGQLPQAIVTMQRRRGKSLGYYSPERFVARDGGDRSTDEIALNPSGFDGHDDRDILSTLVHEMVHHWQCRFGKPGRFPYHNREWADKMEAVGLMPSATGMPGGMRTGDRMSHYRVDGGPFDAACGELLAGGVRLEWQSREGRTNRSKTRYTCPECEVNAWAKPGIHLICGDCEEEMVSEYDVG